MNTLVRATTVLTICLAAMVACRPGANPVAQVSPTCAGSASCIVDSPVPTPISFPSDFPVYPGARLTTAGLNADSPIAGQSMWGMVWETGDSISDVKTFYTAEFRKLGWKVVVSGNPGGSYTAIFNEQNNASRGGMLGIFPAAGVTKISLAWTAA